MLRVDMRIIQAPTNYSLSRAARGVDSRTNPDEYHNGVSGHPRSRHRRPEVDRGDRLTVNALLGEQLDHVFLARLAEG